jgi:hypothetical protein
MEENSKMALLPGEENLELSQGSIDFGNQDIYQIDNTPPPTKSQQQK